MTAEVDVDELVRARAAGAVSLVDVRRPEEYEAGHVAGAVLIPLHELPDRMDELPSPPLYVICRSGSRSATAVDFLTEQQIDAINIAGGTLAWVSAGHDVVTGAEPS